MSKTGDLETSVYHPDAETSDDAVVGKKDGTQNDVKDMRRMGKQQKFRVSPREMTTVSPLHVKYITQVLQRNFGFLSIFGFSMILMSTWESQLG